MARNRFICSSCGAKTPIQSFCSKCGMPTPACTAEDRILWEMGQWDNSRTKQGKAGRSIPLTPSPAPSSFSTRPQPPVSGRPAAATTLQRHPAAPRPDARPATTKPAARTTPPGTVQPRPASAPPQPQKMRPAASTQVPPRPKTSQIAAVTGNTATARALELADPDIAERVVPIQEQPLVRPQTDKAAALSRILRKMPRQTKPVDPEAEAARQAAAEEATRLAHEMEEHARAAAEAEEAARLEEEARRREEARALREAEELAIREAEEAARHEAAERARVAAEEARAAAEEAARLKEEEAQRKRAIEKARAAAAERAKREAEELARIKAEERAKVEAEERAIREAEEEAKKAAEEARIAWEQARKAAEEQERAEAEAAARSLAAKEAARLDEEKRAWQEAQAQAEAERQAALAQQEQVEAEQTKHQKTAAREAKKAAKAARKAADKVEKHRQEAAAHEERKERKTRLDRRYDRQVAALGLHEGETVTVMADGRSMLRRATMFITRYRVAIVSRSRRNPKVRWIPLEEVSEIETKWVGAPTVLVHASVETIEFKQRSKTSRDELVQLIQSEAREARAGGSRRHSADLMQEWIDIANEFDESATGRIRLWVRRHSTATIIVLAALVPFAYFIARSRI